jgi:DNA-binding HxlR family transcriptional regulator
MNGRGKPNAIEGCPLTAAMAAVGGKWKLVIIYWLSRSPLHFAALQRRMEGISHKVMTQQLQELVADGIVNRAETGGIPSPVIYSSTDYGCSLQPLLDQLLRWGRAHLCRNTVQEPVRLGRGAGRRDRELSGELE